MLSVRNSVAQYHDLDRTPAEAVTQRIDMTRIEKFAVSLFSLFAALIVLPALVLSVVSIINTGSIELPH